MRYFITYVGGGGLPSRLPSMVLFPALRMIPPLKVDHPLVFPLIVDAATRIVAFAPLANNPTLLFAIVERATATETGAEGASQTT